MEQDDVARETPGLDGTDPKPYVPTENVRSAAEYADVIDLDWDRLDVGDDVLDFGRH